MDETSTAQRPTLVTLLAVMTMIGSGAYFLYLGAERLIPDLALQSIELPTWITITSIVTQIGKTVAAVFIMRMQRLGFYLYSVLEVVSAIVSIFSGKISMEYMDSTYVNPDVPFDPKFLVLIVMGMSIGLSILFIGGFATHLGKMR